MRGCRELALETGLLMLETTLRDGLLLTPEKIKIERAPESKAARSGQRFSELKQTRASFALMSLEELKMPNSNSPNLNSHLEVFGDFAIGLDPSSSRALDISPVHYYYGRDPDDRYPMIASILSSLIEMRELLSTLARLEERLWRNRRTMTEEQIEYYDAFHRANIDLLDRFGKEFNYLLEQREKVDLDALEAVFNCFPTDRRKLGYLVGSIDLLAGLLQTVDSRSLKVPMYYYSQKEWRLTQVMNETLVGYPLGYSLSREYPEVKPHRKQKKSIVKEVGELIGIPATLDWMNECFVVVGTTNGNRKFRDFVKVVVCPQKARGEVEKICDRLDWRMGAPVIETVPEKRRQRG
ncbi:MAG: hypothetical protein CVV06_05115 [Gammaproteobacteria bacterium HGW-Gammaproteobacteria-10]|nr:MAG: hypothetical protein CVV06_05115 [Gammaproteobacteria bacterium HGW-Gammaproteobacteria-10]